MTSTEHIFHSEFLKVMQARGYIADCTDRTGLDALLAECEKQKKPLVAYIGFDCTAPSLHVGSLVQIMILRRLQQCGHKPIVLMGGATTKIGDPSGKDESRKLLTDAEIEANKDSIKRVFGKFLAFEDTFNAATTHAFMVDNADWLSGINYINFLRDYGRHFSVNKMLSRESVKLRLERESHLSFLEFNYMIMQAFDFLVLANRERSNELHGKYDYGCRLQIGGSDQWGNIVGGIELHRHVIPAKAGIHSDSSTGSKMDSCQFFPTKAGGNDGVYGLTTPLLTTASGGKMGKTEKGAVWLNADLCSPYHYWQFWRNTEDADVGRFLRLFTDIPLEEIAALESLPGAEINRAKTSLANAATMLLHGEQAAQEAEKTARDVFEKGGIGEDLPVVIIEKARLEPPGIPAFELFHKAGLAASGGEARKLIQGGGARINDVKVENEKQSVTLDDLSSEGVIKLSAGKKRHTLVKIG